MKYKSAGLIKIVFLLIPVFLTGGCSGLKPAGLPLASIEGVAGHFRAGRIISLEAEKAISFDQLIDRLESNDIVFVGERHDNPGHHLIQVQILQALMARPKQMAVAMEFFEEPQQAVIDRYMVGATNEETFLKDVAWSRKWGYDYYLYRPLIFLVKEKNGKILAINTPNGIVKKVARSGLGSLNPGERSQLAAGIDLNNKAHRAYLQQVYNEHQHLDLNNFEYFYQAQCVWEDTMAENIGDYFKKERKKLVVLTGNGHIINKFGVPDRVLKHAPASMATVLLYPLSGRVILKKKMADYVWLTGDCSSRLFCRGKSKKSTATGHGF